MTSHVITFFGLSLLLAFAPGPDNLFVLMQSAMYGRTAGMCVVLGLCTGLVVHTAAVAAGLAAVFAASARAFVVLKFVGAIYLVYLAWQAFRAPADAGAAAAVESPNLRRMYARGIIMNITNPKVIIFFLAFLPQFVRAEKESVGLQVMGLGLLFILATIIAFGIITCFAAAIGAMLRRSSRAQRALNWIAGGVFLGLASRLALAAR
jgi:threonine/homoserine/homoserine lactone efflux protein